MYYAGIKVSSFPGVDSAINTSFKAIQIIVSTLISVIYEVKWIKIKAHCWETDDMQTYIARGRVSRWIWHINFRNCNFENIFVILDSGQGRTYYCHGDGGSQLTISLDGTGGALPCQLPSSQYKDGSHNQGSLAPPTPVSRFKERPLIGQEGPRDASDWSPWM